MPYSSYEDFDFKVPVGPHDKGVAGDSWNRHRQRLLVRRAAAGAAGLLLVGAGPAGLTAAYYLAKQGHKVMVFEALPKPGGLPWAS